jgi:hypothetical protein
MAFPDNNWAGRLWTSRVGLLDDVGQRGAHDPPGDPHYGTSSDETDETVEGLGRVSASAVAAVHQIACLPTWQDAMVTPCRRPLSWLISTATTSYSSGSWRC